MKEQTFIDPLSFRELKSGDSVKLIRNGIVLETFIDSISGHSISISVDKNKKQVESMSVVGATNTFSQSMRLKGLKLKTGDLVDLKTKFGKAIRLKVDMILNENILILETPNSKKNWRVIDKLKILFK